MDYVLFRFLLTKVTGLEIWPVFVIKTWFLLLEILVKTLCAVTMLPQNHIHIDEYELYIAKDDIDFDGQYIITQWHGTPEPTILQDSNRCVAKISALDLHRLCTKGSCQQGTLGKLLKLVLTLLFSQTCTQSASKYNAAPHYRMQFRNSTHLWLLLAIDKLVA